MVASRFGTSVTSLIAAFLLILVLAVPVFAAAPRAIWVWEEDSFRLLNDVNYQNEITAYMVRHNITTLYLYADSFRGRNIIVTEPGKYRKFIASMHRGGFQVYALLGSYYLKTWEYILPKKRRLAVRMFGNVLRYNDYSDTGSRFDGVNLDIEPYMLDDWSERKPLRIDQYLKLSAEFMRLKTQAGSTIAVGPAIPFWFDGIEAVAWGGSRKRLSDHVQDIYDYVALMDYRNYAEGRDSIVSHATDELAYADRLGRPVVIGVETGNSEPAKVTFYGKGSDYMEQELLRADTALSRYRSFAGFAIHHLGTYRALTGLEIPDRK